jgi:hypothetical protein
MTTRLNVFDPRVGKWLVDERFPAYWSPDRAEAGEYHPAQLDAMERRWPYVKDCQRHEVERRQPTGRMKR